MAGPAIRLLNFARIMSEHMDIVLAVPNATDILDEDFPIVQYSDERVLSRIIRIIGCDPLQWHDAFQHEKHKGIQINL